MFYGFWKYIDQTGSRFDSTILYGSIYRQAASVLKFTLNKLHFQFGVLLCWFRLSTRFWYLQVVVGYFHEPRGRCISGLVGLRFRSGLGQWQCNHGPIIFRLKCISHFFCSMSYRSWSSGIVVEIVEKNIQKTSNSVWSYRSSRSNMSFGLPRKNQTSGSPWWNNSIRRVSG